MRCRLEAETGDASVEQRPLGSRRVAGHSNPFPIQSASSHPSSYTNISARSRGKGVGGANHQLLNIVYLGRGLCGVVFELSIKPAKNQIGKHLKMGRGKVILGGCSSSGESRQSH